MTGLTIDELSQTNYLGFETRISFLILHPNIYQE